MRDAHERKSEVQRALHLDSWKQARLVAFSAVKPHLKNQDITVMEFMPLPGDEDVKAMREEEALAVIQHYKNIGLLKEGQA